MQDIRHRTQDAGHKKLHLLLFWASILNTELQKKERL